MRFYALLLSFISFSLLSCEQSPVTPTNPPVETNLVLINAFPNLIFESPVDLQHPGDGTDRLFVVEKRGTIKVFDNNELAQSLFFLSITGNVSDGGEQGLLGLAFHPNYAVNGYFYVYYNPNSALSRISRFKVSDSNPNLAEDSSEFILLEFFQDATNHNGGQLAFGEDGYLYISSGDGGPHVNGQDLSTLTGNILRIDVDNPDAGLNYGIPNSNPFVANNLARDEIYAYGLRNPWRMSFDRTTGFLWAGDVGSSVVEEINIIEIGENYGWSAYEGSACRFGPCDPNDGTVPPVFEYDRDPNGSAVTGGYVYRGSLNSQLMTRYVYGDFISGRIWALEINSLSNELLFDSGMNVSAFGIDMHNELYVCDFSGGLIYKFTQE